MPAPDWEPRSPDDLLARVKARGVHLRFRRRFRALSGCVAVLAVTALVAAGAGDDGGLTSLVAADPDEETTTTSSAEDPSASTTTTSTDPERDDQPASSTTTTTAGDASSTTTTGRPTAAEGGSAPTTAPPAVRGPFDPPRLGTYRYRVEVDGSARESRVTYDELGRTDGEIRLSERWDDPGDQTTELWWRDEGVFVPNPDTCDEEGRKTRYLFPLSVGRTWSSDSTCSSEKMGRIHSRSTARVTDFERITVAGQSIDAWVISITGTTDITIAGVKQTHHSEATEWYSAAHGLRVRSVVQVRPEPATGAPTGPSTSEILALDPE